MSQHYFRTEHQGRPVTVLMGWDRPLQGYFLVVQDEQDRDVFVYSNLDDPELAAVMGLPPEVDYFLDKLTALGLHLPGAMVSAVVVDGLLNTGNELTYYNQDGSIQDAAH